MSCAFTLPTPARPAPRRSKRTAMVLVVALLLTLAAGSALLYAQGVRQARLLEHQRTTERLLESAVALATAQRLSTQPGEPDAQAWAQLRMALDQAGLEMLQGPARWAPGLAHAASGLRLASLAPGPAFGETAWVALYDAQAAMHVAMPQASALGRHLGHAALVLVVLWSFAAVAAFVLASRARTGGIPATRLAGATELDPRLVQRLLLGPSREEGAYGAIVLRLENLESIADRHGRAAACTAMETLAEALQLGVRQGDVLARASDDTFVILLTEASPSVLDAALERLRQLAERQPLPFRHDDGTRVHMAAAAARSRPGETLEALLERARALLSANVPHID